MEKTIFFAYKGRYEGTCDENVEAIQRAIKDLNQYYKSYKTESWEDYRKSTPINIDVLNAIGRCEIFVCDLSYFSHNVLFELGFAVGQKKKILVLLNRNIGDAAKTYEEFFLKIIRYTAFTNAKDITVAIQQKNYESDLIEKFANIKNLEDDSNDLLYLRSKIKNQPSLDLNQRIDSLKEEQGFSLLADDPMEVAYRSKCILIHLLGENIKDSFIENAKNSFLAGLACGFDRKVLLVAPGEYKAPLDYYDILKQYDSSPDLVNFAISWLTKELKIVEKVKKIIEEKERHELNLIKLGIGCEVAEYEKEGLLKYFIETSSYYSALKQEKNILVGRKGSGKTAIYIKILNELSKNSLNYVINLKPESDELLEDIQLSNVFTNPASKKAFFISVWKLVILSKLIYSIYEKLMAKPSHASYSPAEEEVLKFVDTHEAFIKKNVFGVILEITKKLKNVNDVNSPSILQELYREYLAYLIKTLKNYFVSTNTKYYKIIVLADNLDQTWDAKSDLNVQSEMIISLLEIENKIKNELINKKGDEIGLRTIIFLRKDIFEYMLKVVKEPDKLVIMTNEINWEEYPELLKQLIDNRFKYSLNLETEEDIEKTWYEFFESKGKKHPFNEIESIVTRRPRDVIYFVSQLFDAAINRGGDKVIESDFNYAIENYTKFLNENLIAETRAEYPEIGDILIKLQEHHGKQLEYDKYSVILSDFGYDAKRKDALTKTLFERGYMLGFDTVTKQPFSDLKILQKKLKERKWLFFRNKVYVIAHAKYYSIKNRADKSF